MTIQREVPRIEVGFRKSQRDAFGEDIATQAREDFSIPAESVKVVDIYSLDGGEVPEDVLQLLARELFSDKIVKDFSTNRVLDTGDFDWVVEKTFQPGAKDNVGETSADAIGDILEENPLEGGKVYTSKRFVFRGKEITREQLEEFADEVLSNETVEQFYIFDRASFEKGRDVPIPRVELDREPRVEYVSLDVPDEELADISARRHIALNVDELKTIREYFSQFGRDPTDAELECLAQSWSEHCKHKIFNAEVEYVDGTEIVDGKRVDRKTVINSLFNTYIKRAVEELKADRPWIKSTLWDNAGVVDFDDVYYFAFKCETHNSPSKEYPYGGVITGIVGVYRDPMGTGMGVRLIYGGWTFCTGDPHYDGKLKPRIHPKRMIKGSKSGLEHGGNKHGVPTINGRTLYHEGFMGKPMMYVEAGGLIPKEVDGKPGYKKRADVGDIIIMAGGRVGIDGIHGATESSLESGSWITKGHVQIGDPYTQKKLHDFLQEARDRGLYKCITDNGAGGLSSSVGEMSYMFAEEGGANGFLVDLEKVPLKYEGLMPWQIAISESQERMTLAVEPGKLEEFMELAEEYDVEATAIGVFTNTGKFHFRYSGEDVTNMDNEFVHEGVPQMKLKARWMTPEERGLREPHLDEPDDYSKALLAMLARPNIASQEWIIRQLDHEVQGTSAVKPLVGAESDVPSDASVLKPVPESNRGLAITSGINPMYSKIDTYHMTANAMDEAIRRALAVGATLDQMPMNDNFCWPSPLPGENNPDAEYKMAQLVRANEALYDYTRTYGTPCISGKDSMSLDGMVETEDGEQVRVSALPTIRFSIAGLVTDVEKCVTMDFKNADDSIYILGQTKDELGGSEYYEMMDEVGRNVPLVDAGANLRCYRAFEKALQKGLVSSAHGCYKGGLGVALAQSCMGGNLGAQIDLSVVPGAKGLRADRTLFSESAGRLVISVSPEKEEAFMEIMEGTKCERLGTVTSNDSLYVQMAGKDVLKVGITPMKEAWKGTYGDM